MNRWLSIAALILTIGAITLPAEAAPSPPTKEEWRAANESYLVESLKRPGWTATASGLQYHVTKAVPDAPKPAPGSEVAVHYDGRLINNVVFDMTDGRKEPATFSLGGVIKGWQEGVAMMRVGEIWEFVIPAGLAYGEADRDPIPGGSALRFRIELIAAKTTVK